MGLLQYLPSPLRDFLASLPPTTFSWIILTIGIIATMALLTTDNRPAAPPPSSPKAITPAPSSTASPSSSTPKSLTSLPTLGDPQTFRSSCLSLLRSALPETWYRMPTPDGDRILMPHRYVDELKNRPRGDLSFTKANSDILLGKWTGIDEVNEQSIEVVAKDLTRSIPALLPEIQEEVAYAFAREFEAHAEGEKKADDEWREVQLHEKILRIVSMVSNRIFVTKEVSRTEDWIQTSIQYTADVFAGGQELKKWHPWLRPLMFRLLAPMRRLETMKATARRLLFPILEARQRKEKAGGGKKPEYKDTVHWMQERSAHIPTFDFREQAHIQLIIGLAAIHTTGMATTHMLYDLAARQEYVEPLRKEVEKVLGQEGGKLTKQGLGKLRLMDSFMKESQRLSPIALTFFTRKTSVPITLHDGFHVPPGTHLTCNEQEPSPNSRVWGELDKFDGFRFAKRADEGVEESSKLAFHTTSVESMAFGHGRHACPGRYFAEAEIKAILCHLLMNYDITFPDTVKERPQNIFFETAIMPDPTQKVLLRRRR